MGYAAWLCRCKEAPAVAPAAMADPAPRVLPWAHDFLRVPLHELSSMFLVMTSSHQPGSAERFVLCTMFMETRRGRVDWALLREAGALLGCIVSSSETSVAACGAAFPSSFMGLIEAAGAPSIQSNGYMGPCYGSTQSAGRVGSWGCALGVECLTLGYPELTMQLVLFVFLV